MKRFSHRAMLILGAVWAILFCFILNTGVVHAATPRQAERAVESKLRSRGMASVEVSCDRTGARRFVCDWNALSRADVRNGRTEGTDGLAFVTTYGRTLSVRLV